MAIGCLGVERRGERFFILSHSSFPGKIRGDSMNPHVGRDLSLEAGSVCVCVYYCRTFYKAVRVGEEESGGHVL